MILYLDTSSLVKLYVDEEDTERVTALVGRASVLATSSVTYVEARAAFARHRRERSLTPAAHAAIVHRLDADWRSLVAIDVTAPIAQAAGALADRLGLRGMDAIHLATFAEVVARADDEDAEFSAADDRLVRAARRLG